MPFPGAGRAQPTSGFWRRLAAIRAQTLGDALGGAPPEPFPVARTALLGVLASHGGVLPAGIEVQAKDRRDVHGECRSAPLALHEQAGGEIAPILHAALEAHSGADDDLVARGPAGPPAGNDLPLRLAPTLRRRISPLAMDRKRSTW